MICVWVSWEISVWVQGRCIVIVWCITSWKMWIFLISIVIDMIMIVWMSVWKISGKRIRTDWVWMLWQRKMVVLLETVLYRTIILGRTYCVSRPRSIIIWYMYIAWLITSFSNGWWIGCWICYFDSINIINRWNGWTPIGTCFRETGF